MTDQIIAIIPIGEVSVPILRYIAEVIEQRFNITARIELNYKIPDGMPDPVYSRINSSKVLSCITDNIGENIYKVLTVTEFDLYSPIFSRFFGEAQLQGKCAIVSICRLRQEYYNLRSDEKIFLARCKKVVIHEMAHMFGLRHCNDSNCVMYSSNSIADTDIKSDLLCPSCEKLLKELMLASK